MNINYIKQALDYAVRKAAEKVGMGQPSRNRKLSLAGIIRLLVGAEGRLFGEGTSSDRH